MIAARPWILAGLLATLAASSSAQEHWFTRYGNTNSFLGDRVVSLGDLNRDGRTDFAASASAVSTAPTFSSRRSTSASERTTFMRC